jgi:uncharacterized protein
MLRPPGPPGTLLRSVVWRNLAADGSDYCSLWQMGRSWLLQGTAIVVLKDGRPMLADYEIECDRLWHTRRVAATCLTGSTTRSIDLTVEASRLWRSSGEELPTLGQCSDIDLAVTPATNTLPIRRLNLEIGQSREVAAAWLKFPDLTLEVLPQRYTRLDPQRYRYQSGTGFSAELLVDDLGLVTTYPDGWERAAGL